MIRRPIVLEFDPHALRDNEPDFLGFVQSQKSINRCRSSGIGNGIGAIKRVRIDSDVTDSWIDNAAHKAILILCDKGYYHIVTTRQQELSRALLLAGER